MARGIDGCGRLPRRGHGVRRREAADLRRGVLVSGLDAFFPLVPSETAVIAAGTLAGTGDLFVWLVLPAAALGAFAGDSVSYGLGAIFGERAARRLFRGEQGARRLRKAQRLLDRYGALVIVLARFIPGGGPRPPSPRAPST